MTGSAERRYLEAPRIETPRLCLRPYRLSDFDLIRAFYATERAAFVGGQLSPRVVWDGMMNCVGQWAIFGFGGWAVDRRSDGVTIGEIAIQRPANYPETELGWILFGGFEGQGYAYEMAMAARTFGFSTLGLGTLVSYVDRANDRSIRLARRLGAVLDPAAATPNDEDCLTFRHHP